MCRRGGGGNLHERQHVGETLNLHLVGTEDLRGRASKRLNLSVEGYLVHRLALSHRPELGDTPGELTLPDGGSD